MHKDSLSTQIEFHHLISLQIGKEEGLEYYFNLHYGSIVCFVTRMIGNESAAEEVAANCFIKLWEKRTSLSPEGSIKTWLYTAAKNASIDYLRKQKRLQKRNVLLFQELLAPNILENMILAETIRQVINTMDELPKGTRAVCRKLFLEGKSLEEIARELNLSLNTIRNQKARGIRMLKAILR